MDPSSEIELPNLGPDTMEEEYGHSLSLNVFCT